MQHEDNGGLKDLASRRVEVAKEDLKTAKLNLKEEHYRAAKTILRSQLLSGVLQIL